MTPCCSPANHPRGRRRTPVPKVASTKAMKEFWSPELSPSADLASDGRRLSSAVELHAVPAPSPTGAMMFRRRRLGCTNPLRSRPPRERTSWRGCRVQGPALMPGMSTSRKNLSYLVARQSKHVTRSRLSSYTPRCARLIPANSTSWALYSNPASTRPCDARVPAPSRSVDQMDEERPST